MIRSFADRTTEDIWNGADTKVARRVPKLLWKRVQRKLDLLNRASSLQQLRVPPSNELHALTDDRSGQHAIRVNDQYRITFRFADRDAHEVRCEDYH